MQIAPETLIANLKADSQALALPDGRCDGQPGQDVAREYLVSRLTALGLTPFRGNDFTLEYEIPHPVRGKSRTFVNLVAVIPGRDRSLPPILLGAHYNSVIEAPSVDDNATSVALNLAIAEEFRKRPGVLRRDLIIAFFDEVEPAHFHGAKLGSTRFHEDHCADTDFAAVIISDRTGHDLCLRDLGLDAAGTEMLRDQAGEMVFLLGADSDPVFPDIVEAAAAATLDLQIFPTLSDSFGNVSDHLTFEKKGQPFLFLSCARGRSYQRERGDLRWINFAKMARITEFVAALIERIDICPGNRSRSPQDTTEFELRMIQRVAGTSLPLLLRLLGVALPRNRRDLDQLIGSLVPRV